MRRGGRRTWEKPMRMSGKSWKRSNLAQAAARRKSRRWADGLEMLESRVLLTGTFSAADMAGTWTYSAMDESGTIVLDASNHITGGSLTHADGSVTVPAGSYTIASDGTVALTIGADVRTGAMNVTREAMTVATAGTYDTLSMLVKRSGAIFSNSDLNGSWAMFLDGDSSASTGMGLIGFDGAGHISATGSVKTSDGTTAITGGTYAVAANGSVTMTLNITEPGGALSNEALTGAITDNRNVLALNPVDLQSAATGGNPRLFTMVAKGGLYSNTDFKGAWTIAADGVEGTLTFNGAGAITGGAVTDSHGQVNTVTGTYAVSPVGTFTVNLRLTQGLTHTALAMNGTLNATRNVAAMEQPPSAAVGNANSKHSLTMLVRGANRAPTLTHITALSTAFAGQPFDITYSTLAGTSNATDFDQDPVQFSVETLGTGTLTLDGTAVTVGQLVSAGDTLVWTPAVGRQGNLTAFSMKAFDGTATSATAMPVLVKTVLPATVRVVASRRVGSEINNGTTVGIGQFTVTRSNGDLSSTLDVTVALSGTATNGTDYTTIPTTLTLAAGQRSKTVNVVAVNDRVAEGTETAILTIQSSAAYGIVAASSQAQVSILDSSPTVSIAANRPNATETKGQTTGLGQFTVTRTTQNISVPQVVHYMIDGSAVAGTNYTALSGTVTILAGKTTATINVNPIDDGTADATLTVTATLVADPSYNLTPTLAHQSATVQIIDNASTISITATKPLATELNGPTTGFGLFTLTRTGGDRTKPLTVNYTVGGTAAADGTDYTPVLAGRVTFAPNVTTASIKINPVDDVVIEGTKTVILTLAPDANPSYRLTAVLAQRAATVSIKDHNRAPAFATVNTLAGATMNTPFAIRFESFLTATDVVDPEGVPISFKIMGVLSGTLRIDHGGDPVAVVRGVTLFGAGDTLTWTPALNATGTLNAFLVAATDGVNVTPAKLVKVTVI